MKEIKDLVKDPEWQKLRMLLIGKWKVKPEWCCQQLRKYLGPISSTSTDKLRIILNYTTGTAFRIGIINPPCVLKLRGEVSAELKKRKFQKKEED
jgi:hypothetical protein